MEMRDYQTEQEAKDRLADIYTSAELVEILDIPVEDIIAEYWERILENEIVCGQLALGS